MSCGCYCCRKPRYKRLVDALYPEDPQDVSPVASNLDKLLYFARSSPEHLDRVGEYLAWRLRRSLGRDRRGHVCVSLKIMEKLASECEAQQLQLITDSYLAMLQALLENTDSDLQIMATDSFVLFSEREEQTTPYHRQYDFFIHRFAAMSLVKSTSSQQLFQKTRQAGLRGLRGVIKKTQGDEQLNIWEPPDMNKIIPPFLFNMQHNAALSPTQALAPSMEDSLAVYAEEGLKELVSSAELAHIDSVIQSVLQHFDLNQMWTKQRDFTVSVFITIIETMQKQHRYKGIQSLVVHLDAKAKESCDLKQGILDTLSQCVAVAAEGSLGPSVLDVFRTLVRHLRISIENDSSATDITASSTFQRSITTTMGEFAGVLPNYHKPDIMSLITSYMSSNEEEAETMHPIGGTGSPMLTASLVKCMKSIANTYQPEVLETTFPETLFTSLVYMLKITDHETQLDVCELWQKLIDHHGNRENIPLHTQWETLQSAGLTLGKVSQRFIAKNKAILYENLTFHALHLSPSRANLQSFYLLLCLLSLEFARPGILDMTHFLSKLQDTAQDPTANLSPKLREAFHAIIAGVLYLLAKISPTVSLEDHVGEVLEKRRKTLPMLLPDGLFGAAEEEGADGGGVSGVGVSDEMLFHLKEWGMDRQSPEPVDNQRASFLMREYSTSSSDFLPHASLSLDYGMDSPLSTDQINFSSFKEGKEREGGRGRGGEGGGEEGESGGGGGGGGKQRGKGSLGGAYFQLYIGYYREKGCEILADSAVGVGEGEGEGEKEGLEASLTFEQQLGISSKQTTGLGDIEHLIVQTTSSATEQKIQSAYDLELPSLNNGL